MCVCVWMENDQIDTWIMTSLMLILTERYAPKVRCSVATDVHDILRDELKCLKITPGHRGLEPCVEHMLN